MVCSRYPKECRYYDTVLKRKCLTKLKNNVWESKTKWKLVDQANAHWKCKLLFKYFGLWRGYVVERFKKEINARVADSFHEERLKARGMSALKKNAEQNRMLMRICRRKFEGNLKFRLWHQWKHYAQKRQKVKEIKFLANRIREERLRIRYIYVWSFRLNEKRSQVDNLKKITAKYETNVKRKCLDSWKLFTKRKKCKRKIENLAIACHKDKIVERCFLSWKEYSFRKRRNKNQAEIIQSLYVNNLIKNYLDEWRGISKRKKFQRKLANNQSAVNFRNRKLLEKSFGILQKAREARRRIRDKMKQFRSRYENIYISFYLNAGMRRRTEKFLWKIHETKAVHWRENWLKYWTLTKLVEKYKERAEEKEEMTNIVKYSDAITMHRAFRGWKEVISRKLQKKMKAQQACEYHYEKLIQRAFTNWKGFVCIKFKKRMADDYYKNGLLFKCINRWRVLIEEKRMKIKEAKNLERIRETKLMKEAFTCWRSEMEILKSKTTTAVRLCNRSKLSKAFYTWRGFTQRKIIRKNRYNANRTILRNIIIKNVIFLWKKAYVQRQRVNRKLEKFRTKKGKRLVNFCFVSWSGYIVKMKNIHESTLRYPQLKSFLLTEAYIDLLSKALELKKIAKRKEELARRTEEKLLKRKYFKKLTSFVCWKKEKVLACVSEKRREEGRQKFDVAVSTGRGIRRKPIIPDYLKAHIHTHEFQEKVSVNEETFRVVNPTNRKLPAVGYHRPFALFEG